MNDPIGSLALSRPTAVWLILDPCSKGGYWVLPKVKHNIPAPILDREKRLNTWIKELLSLLSSRLQIINHFFCDFRKRIWQKLPKIILVLKGRYNWPLTNMKIWIWDFVCHPNPLHPPPPDLILKLWPVLFIVYLESL